MELIAAILFAGPLGYFVRNRKRSLVLYIVLWAIVFPIQTVAVRSEDPDAIEPSYFVINAVILAVGIGLNALGARVRQRSRAESPGATSPPS